MRRIITISAVMLGLLRFADAQELKLPRPSQSATVKQTIGLTDVSITYSRPGVKGRTIWGGLVPYDRVWRTGANEATSITFSQDVRINGNELPAGTYSLHTIPAKDEWTVIFNNDAKQWGSYSYDASKDALRVKAKASEGAFQEWMMFSFPEVTVDSATLELAWEKLRVSLKIETDTMKQAMANIKDALDSDWVNPYRAAGFVTGAGPEHQAEAMQWIQKSVSLKETYWNLRLMAELLAKDGKTAEAVAAAEKAVKLGKENKDEPSEVAKTEKQIQEWKAAAGK